jgi:hypothetical protein
MTTCRETVRVQDFLDGDLPPAEAMAFRTHLSRCGECTAELVAFQRVIATLEEAPLPSPRPELTGRILARVLPSRIRRRRLAALGWTYVGALAACAGIAALWSLAPASHGWLAAIPAEVSHRLLGLGLFVLNALGASLVHLADGWRWLHAVGDRLAPLSRALGTVLGQRGIVVTVWAAAAACAALLWWMRPRSVTAVREVRHVSVLGI